MKAPGPQPAGPWPCERRAPRGPQHPSSWYGCSLNPVTCSPSSLSGYLPDVSRYIVMHRFPLSSATKRARSGCCRHTRTPRSAPGVSTPPSSTTLAHRWRTTTNWIAGVKWGRPAPAALADRLLIGRHSRMRGDRCRAGLSLAALRAPGRGQGWRSGLVAASAARYAPAATFLRKELRPCADD
jgi:hypothetical protein